MRVTGEGIASPAWKGDWVRRVKARDRAGRRKATRSFGVAWLMLL